ncbi:MAG: hypothetical protein SW127_16315 [Actinomycetota bacterium]|nr:hypothetical protein [Actinomycetota bacterium]
MTDPQQHSTDQESTPTSRPVPNMMPRSVGAASPAADAVGDMDPSSVTTGVGEILEQVDEIRRASGDTFDLAALGRQAELLERAHEVLITALEDVDPR